ncbi:cytochrome P450 [Streptomonospora nanhaiensis]|uniref:cytochrome P450 n=1 Tax=Streptomonospora nanhaiensis TaxID=1323731 RepID=UPI001C3810DD|nr:cytochrome P450 [Streptomonospora nanhaiensis]MBV2364039.1 cytochrome P450 [Streptomonospora nanhaiensis]MBX9388678.1 cytochrome P450 [Streptomonospora nanhaiensis]
MATAGPGTSLLMDVRLRLSPAAEEVDTRGEPPVWRAPLPDGSRVWVATGHDAVRSALTAPSFRKPVVRGGERWERYLHFTDPRTTGSIVRSMLNADGEDHRRLRALAAPALGPDRLREAAAHAARLAEHQLDLVSGHGRADLVHDFAHPFAVRVVTELYGYPPEFTRRVLRLPRWSPAPVFSAAGSPERERYGAEREAMSALLGDLVAAKRRAPGPDPISEIIARADSAGLDHGQVTSTLFILLVAAYEPVTDFLTTSLYCLWQRPELLSDPGAAVAGLSELLRYTSPLAVTMPRFAVEPTELGGVELAPGDAVVLHLALANRDPERFRDPNRLDLTRRVDHDLAFAHGPHYCLGTRLAVLLCRTALEAVLRRLPGLVPTQPLENLSWQPGSFGPLSHLHVTAGLKELPVAFEPQPPRRPAVEAAV